MKCHEENKKSCIFTPKIENSYYNCCISVTMAGTCNNKKVFSSKFDCLYFVTQTNTKWRLNKIQCHCCRNEAPTYKSLLTKGCDVATLQMTLSNRISNPKKIKKQGSFDPNEDITRPIFSKYSPAAFISWAIKCLDSDVYEKLICFLVCLVLFVGRRMTTLLKPGPVGGVHVCLRRKWKPLMAADGRWIKAAGHNISDGRLDRQGTNNAQ